MDYLFTWLSRRDISNWKASEFPGQFKHGIGSEPPDKFVSAILKGKIPHLRGSLAGILQKFNPHNQGEWGIASDHWSSVWSEWLKAEGGDENFHLPWVRGTCVVVKIRDAFTVQTRGRIELGKAKTINGVSTYLVHVKTSDSSRDLVQPDLVQPDQ